MKNGFLIMFVSYMALAITVYACKDESEGNELLKDPTITISESENLYPVLPQEGGTVYVNFTATSSWEATLANTRADSWINISPSSGNTGKYKLSINANANDSHDERNATIFLKCGTVSKTIIVTQKQKMP